jgi:hypothetical protein
VVRVHRLDHGSRARTITPAAVLSKLNQKVRDALDQRTRVEGLPRHHGLDQWLARRVTQLSQGIG